VRKEVVWKKSRAEKIKAKKRSEKREEPEEPHVASFSPHHAPGIEGDPVV
jgi:hypothetical protein